MKAITVKGKIDEQGHLFLEQSLQQLKSTAVRVILIVEDLEQADQSISEVMSDKEEKELMSFEKFQQGFKTSLREAGYDSREKIINLVQEIKREIVEERQKEQGNFEP